MQALEASAVGSGSLAVHPVRIGDEGVLEYVLEDTLLGAAHEERLIR